MTLRDRVRRDEEERKHRSSECSSLCLSRYGIRFDFMWMEFQVGKSHQSLVAITGFIDFLRIGDDRNHDWAVLGVYHEDLTITSHTTVCLAKVRYTTFSVLCLQLPLYLSR